MVHFSSRPNNQKAEVQRLMGFNMEKLLHFKLYIQVILGSEL